MKLIDDYLKKDLDRENLDSWDDIRSGYLERAAELLKNDWQSPSYLHSIKSQAGRREGKIIGNINDYTRDQHDLALVYEKKFCQEYLPKILVFPIEPYVTNSGMSALTTIITMIHREHGVNNTILVGKHSYFQNLEILSKSFAKVILFDENDKLKWEKLIVKEQPLAVFVDTLCNESELTVPPVIEIAKYLEKHAREKCYFVADNSMLGLGFPWKKLLMLRSRKLSVIGWESLNKYYEFGLDRTMGGIVWGSDIRTRAGLSVARRHTGSIMPDASVAMLPTPNRVLMQKYLERIEQNRKIMMEILGSRVISANTDYEFSGAQIIIKLSKKTSYDGIQKLIKKIIGRAKKENIQLIAGTSFGMPNTRIYLTAKHTEFAQMFLRVSVGTEEINEIVKIARVIVSSL